MRFVQKALITILGLSLLEASALADSNPGNVVVEARRGQVEQRDHRRQQPRADYPTQAPPERRVENVKRRKNYVWVGGQYEWRDGAYVWVTGHWEKRHRQQQWQDGHWERQGDRYVWIEGGWIGTSDQYPQQQAYPTTAPPPAPVEGVAPQAGYVWIDGNYAWQNGAYAWVSGHWEVDQIGKRWQAGYWAQQASGYYAWVDGYWVDVPVPPLPAPPAPRPGYVWIDGSYVWQSGAYVWTEGHWERAQRPQYPQRPRRGHRW